MKKHFKISIFLSLIVACSSSSAGQTVVANDTEYKVLETEQAHFIYSPKLIPELKQSQIKALEIKELYQDSFAYKMDEALSIGLLSDKNQIANGFSTPSPFNMQINYLGGTQSIDYFSTNSWLDTLLYHETAHNYQINPKNNPVSCFMKKTMGNNASPIFLNIIPFFTFPNAVLPTVLIEGNAVLNESWHGNGGRLYSGRAYALLLSQLKAGRVTPTRLINSHLYFPYGEEKYLIGGYFWLYLSETYGLDKTNQFYLSSSKHYINPFQTNKSFIRHFGLSFEQAVEQFTQHYIGDAKQFIQLDGETIATTLSFSFMSRTQDEVLLLTDNGKDDPELHRIHRHQGPHKIISGQWLNGKPFIYQGKAVTAASHITSPELIEQGLFDNNGLLQAGTGSKILQSNNNDKALWFDVPNSFIQAQLMQGDAHQENGQFLDAINSSALIGEQGEIYYFKQEDKTRTLYRDQQPLFSYQGHYGIVVDSDQEGRVYFIAASKFGSSLFVWADNKIQRLSTADNIIDAKIMSHLNHEQIQWLVATVTAEHIKYLPLMTDVASAEESAPYESILWFERHGPQQFAQSPTQSTYKACLDPTEASLQESPQDYSLLSHTRYSAFTPNLNYSSMYGLTVNVQLSFTDPLKQNELLLFASRDENNDYLAGFNYLNNRNRLEYGGGFYGISRETDVEGARNYGGELFTQYKLIQQGFHLINTKLQFIADDEFADKNTATLSLNYAYLYQQNLRLYPNKTYSLNSFTKSDRGDVFLGARANWLTGLPYDFFIGMDGKYVGSTTSELSDARGIRFSNQQVNPSGDISDFEMLALDGQFYAKTAWQAGGSIKKQFDLPLYFFTFPMSLRREALYVDQHRYKAYNTTDNSLEFNETIAGMTIEFLLLNKFPVPVSFEYIYNDNTLERSSYRIKLGLYGF